MLMLSLVNKLMDEGDLDNALRISLEELFKIAERDQRHESQLLANAHIEYLLCVGKIYLQKRDYNGAINSFKLVRNSGGEAQGAEWHCKALRQQAAEQKSQGNIIEARKYMEEALNVSPQNAEVRQELADIYSEISRQLESGGSWDVALSFAQMALSLVGDNDVFKVRAERVRGCKLAASGSIVAAAQCFMDSLRPDPNCSSDLTTAYTWLIKTGATIGDSDVICKILDAFGVNDKSVQLAHAVPLVMIYSEYGVDKLITIFEKYLESGQINLPGYMGLGASYDIKGETEKAKICFDRVLETYDHLYFIGCRSKLQQYPYEVNSSYKEVNINLPKTNKKFTVVVYSNCQTKTTIFILRKILSYVYDATVLEIQTWDGTKPIYFEMYRNTIASADVVIYQPLGFATGFLGMPQDFVELISKECMVITLPYIFNTALWSMVYNPSYLTTSRSFKQLVDSGISEKDLIGLYDAGELDFAFEARWKKNMKMLRYVEGMTDVKVADFIETNVRDQYLFNSESHLTYGVYVEFARQVVAILIKNGVPLSADAFEAFANHDSVIEFTRRASSCEYLPADNYSRDHYQFTWLKNTPENDEYSRRYYHKLIGQAVNRILPVNGEA